MTTPTTVQIQLQIRADTAANWISVNPLLLANEVALETDTKKIKVGDGSTYWAALPYFPSIVSGGTLLGNLEIGSTGTLTFEGATANTSETTLGVVDPTADRTILLPDQSGTVVVSGNASITDADIAANAEIAVSKLANGTANQVLVTDGTDVSWSDNLTLAGDLTVNGTTTTINTETLTVKDKNIELAVVDTPTDATADGGGITLKGATDKTINWIDATDAWTSSERFSVPLGTAGAPSLTFTGDENTGIYSPGADQLALSTSGVGRVFVDASGNVGVGAVLNTSKFNVLTGTSNSTVMELTGASAGRGLKISTYANVANDAGVLIEAPWANYGQLAFGTAGSERLRITSAGLVGVGTSTPDAKLRVADTNGCNLYVGFSSGVLDYNIYDATEHLFRSTNGSSEYGRFDSSGRLGIGTSSPDSLLEVRDSAASGIISRASNTQGTNTNKALKVRNNSDTDTFTVSYRGQGYFADSVGIGTTSPSAMMHVQRTDTANNYVFVESVSAGNAGLQLKNNSGTYTIIANADLRFRDEVAGTDRLRIDSSGRLLVGTSTDRSGSNLQVEGTSFAASTATLTQNSTTANAGATIRLGKSRGTTNNSKTVVASGDRLGNILYFGADGASDITAATIEAFVDGTPGANDMPGRLVFSTTADGASSPTERMRIWSTGRVSINTTAVLAQGQVEVQHDGAVTQGINVADSSSEPTSTAMSFIKAAGTRGSITVTSTATAYNTSSDYRLKENVTPVTDGITRLQQLKPSRFNFIADPDKTVDGFLAHEVQTIVPEAITGEKDAVDNEGNPVYQGIDQSKLVPLLTAALQEAIGRIETLEAEVAALKAS